MQSVIYYVKQIRAYLRMLCSFTRVNYKTVRRSSHQVSSRVVCVNMLFIHIVYKLQKRPAGDTQDRRAHASLIYNYIYFQFF